MIRWPVEPSVHKTTIRRLIGTTFGYFNVIDALASVDEIAAKPIAPDGVPISYDSFQLILPKTA